MILLMITLVSGAFLQGTCKTSAATGDVVRTLNCNIVIKYYVAILFNEYRQDENGNRTDDRCDGVTANADGVVKIPATVKTVRHINGLTNYSVTINKKQNWEAKGWGAGENYEYEQGSWIKCSGYVKADNLTMSGVVSNSQFDAAGHGLFDITDRFGNDFTFVMDNYYDTNTDWVIDYMDPTGTGITGISLEFIYPAYTVTYDNGGGTGSIASSDVGYNQKFTLSDGAGMSKEGYELDNWCVLRKTHRNSYNDFDIMTEVFCTDGQWHEFTGAYATNTADAKWQTYNKKSSYTMDGAWIKGEWDNVFVFCAQWKKKETSTQPTTASYTIKHYLQNADGTYSYRESTTGNAAIGNTIADMRKNYDGYTQPAVKSVKISSNASDNVIEYRYPRKTYKINISGDKGISAVRHYSITDSKTKDSYRWGESVRINADVKEGYTWSKWTGVSNVKNKKYDFTMPQSDVNRKATTTAMSYTYTVKYYWQNADGTYTEKKDLTVTGKAGFGTKVSAPLLKYEKETDADKFNPSVNKMTDSRYYPTTNKKDKITQAATITIGTKPENNVITYYYNRKTYPMKLSYKTGISGVTHYSYTDKSSKNEYRWGESVKIEAAVKDGYSFSRWTSNEAGNADKYTNPYEFIMPVIYVDRIANAVKKTADVTIEHYVMDTDGKYPAAPKKTQTVKYEYFTLLKSEQLKDNSLIKAGAIEYDPDSTKRETLVTGSTVIKLYYKRIKHNVTFNAAYNGGRHASGDSKDITVQFYYGADIPLDSYRAMKLNNYKFKGWNTSPDAKDVLGRQKMGTSDITYYAVYYGNIYRQ